MNQREAKRAATDLIAGIASGRADQYRQRAEAIRAGSVVTALTAADTERLARACDELAEELARRVSRERRPSSAPVDPNQMSILEVP